MTYDSSTARDDAYEGRAIVAAFADRDGAHAAAHALREDGFHRTWIGVTAGGNHDAATAATGTAGASGTMVETDDGDSVMDKIGRFFSGESGEKTLYDELVRHGVASSEARRIDGSLAPSSAILTVDGSNHPELAAQTIESFGGHVLAGESFGAATVADTATSVSAAEDASDTGYAAASVRGSQLLGYGSADQYARGAQIDEQRRLQLREERLSIDKQQVAAGEAQIGKTVVEHQLEVDVPTTREELFIERRPVSDSAATASSSVDTSPIVEGETIRVPLMREEVVVTKRPVVTEEIVIGKRQVTESKHVSETTREEQLRVDGATGANGTTPATATSANLGSGI